jgi:hypothetical protein
MSNSKRNAVPFWLNTAAVLMATSCLTPVDAFGACVPGPAQSGDTVICTGTETAGIGDNTQSNVTVTINPGAIVKNDAAPPFRDFAISLVSDNKITNNGQIEGRGGVFLGGFNNVIENGATGVIDVSDTGIYATGGSLVVNGGTIRSGNQGVYVTDTSSLVNTGDILVKGENVRGVHVDLASSAENSGTVSVEATSYPTAIGFRLNGANTLTNNGDILVSAVAYGGIGHGVTGSASNVVNNELLKVEADQIAVGVDLVGGRVTNAGTIDVTSADKAFGLYSNYDMQIDNSGLIHVKGTNKAYGVMTGTTIKNSGTIIVESDTLSVGLNVSGFEWDIIPIDNIGSITADVAITAFQNSFPGTPPAVHINNSGDIKGDILLFQQSDFLLNKAGGKIVGDIDMGGGSDIIINLGSIDGVVQMGDGDDFFFTADGSPNATVDGGADFDSIGIYSNTKQSGALAGADGFEGVAVFADKDAEFTITGITANGDFSLGLVGSGVVINATSLISTVDGRPVVRMLGDGLDFRNEGVISGGTGVRIDGASQTFVNGGEASISAKVDGIVAKDNQRITMLDGSSITAGGVGIRAGDGNEIVNGGTIVAATGTGMDLGNANTVTNTGTITANIGIKAGDANRFSYDANAIENAGTIVAGATGILAEYSDVKNSGKLTAGSIGISVDEGSTVENSGTITVGAGGQGILNRGGGVENAGTITSKGDGVVTVNTVVNTGSISATGNAIKVISDGINLYNGGTLSGANAFLGGAGSDSVSNSGTVRGNILLGGGDDEILLFSGFDIDGDIDGGIGGDVITGSGNGVFSGKVTGIETLNVTGGVLEATLDNGSAIGSTSVQAGGLRLDGSLTGNVAVAQGAVFEGKGSLSGALTNAGTVSPGNSIGTLNLTGSYTQTSTGQFLVELDAASADRLVVSGTATLDGVLSSGLVASDYATLKGKSYTVLSAGAISGAFDNLGAVQQGFWTLNIVRSGTSVNVTVTDVTVPLGATQPITSTFGNALQRAATTDSEANTAITLDSGSGEQGATSLRYDAMGDWETSAAALTGTWNEMGPRTPAGAMPKTGTAAFEGTTKGELHETGAPEAFVVEGNVLLSANFASGLVNADFTGMEKIDPHGVVSAWVDFRARMSIADGTSEFTGTAGTDDGVWKGEAQGGFYGDEGGVPGRAAGLWSIASPLGQALGGFMARRR